MKGLKVYYKVLYKLSEVNIYTRQLKNKLHIYYILLSKTIHSPMAINGSAPFYLSGFYNAINICCRNPNKIFFDIGIEIEKGFNLVH
jgi:hypothetical protein